jgi:molecular chaperone GrpE (heat shock protein)
MALLRNGNRKPVEIMTERSEPKLPKWPFLVSDAALLALALWTSARVGAAGLWPLLLCFAAVALGAWLCIIPFLREYSARLKFAEADALTSAVAQMQNLENIKSRIVEATGRWQGIQDTVNKTLHSAREVSERMTAQTQEFYTFFQRAGDQEKTTLRLELEKMKRAEAEWLQVVVRILDYVYALHHAGVRSGQADLINELTQFQNACRDAARRVGLIPFLAAPNEAFDARIHQVPDTHAKPASDSTIEELLAPGFRFQTQLLRRALVKVAAREKGELPQICPLEGAGAQPDGAKISHQMSSEPLPFQG